MSKKRILIAGFGNIARRHLRNLRSLLPDAEIAVLRQHSTVRESDIPDGADRLFRRLDAAQAFDPALAIVSGPASTHVAVAEALAATGAHLFLEKPLAMTAEEGERLLEFGQQPSRFVMVGYILRFLPTLKLAWQRLRSGDLGTVWSARIQVGQYLPDWRPGTDFRQGVSARKSLGGGVLMELSHEIDYALWLFGKPNAVHCSCRRISGFDLDVEDHANLILEYGPAESPETAGWRNPRGFNVSLDLDFLQCVAQMEVQIAGDRGTFKADLIGETAHILRRGGTVEPCRTGGYADGNAPYVDQFDFLLARCFEDYRPRRPELRTYDGWCTLSQAVDVMRVVDRARQANSSAQRQPIFST